MAYKQGHESLESYTDNLKVKISERYKPPPRISSAMTYSQRLTLNKQTQDNMPTYEFSLEKTVLEKMREWKVARMRAVEERQSKLEKVREEMIRKREQEQLDQEQPEETEAKTVNETVAVTDSNNFVDNTTVPFVTNVGTGISYYNYTTNNSILMPTQASNNYSTILTPIPLQNYGNQQFSGKKDDKSPFNISDFENDTSSPFDNMELKSINDMEELAQVLNKGERVQKDENTTYPLYQNMMMQPQSSYTNYLGNQYSSYIPNSSSYVAPTNTNYSYTNGYYYSPDMMQQNQSFSNPYNYSKTNLTNYTYANPDPFQESSQPEASKRSSCKSVPDIISALESELENIQVSNKNETSFIRSSYSSQAVRPKSTDGVCTDRKKKVEENDDPFSTLSKDDQDLCRLISSMGFPIARVARVCKLLGNDQKKIVDHLLALSDLLDLGFSEKKVSDALLQCDNDRDKALDKLIL